MQGNAIHDVESLNQRFQKEPPQSLVAWGLEQFGRHISLACSLGMEDVALVHMLCSIDRTARIFVLDTGRLHESTYETMEALRSKYAIDFELYFPEAAAVEQLVREKGAYSFYQSVENRKQCCQIRKVAPLQRALQGAEAWFTGLRREQSQGRAETLLVERDDAHGGILKLNPLAYWSLTQLQQFIDENRIPLHPLHRRGYPSIGCEPCTRAVEPGEDLRAGRWWWELDNKECGLHTKS
ncbi:MAG: phosphoadenylyl-sulfate reductase [Leptospirales bacterium]|nr:phosphoadenylyl-sulfate reductase [Leptospirales bacterium]